MSNKDLQAKYDQMHSQGVSSWFSDGREERETILKMGEPWREKTVLEIGSGDGRLGAKIFVLSDSYFGIDYSERAIERAIQHFGPSYKCMDYHEVSGKYDRIVMQGVLEHLDDPFAELKWMIDNLLVFGGDVITSSPCFLNPRGIVWMTLDMLGAVMSKTDLHYLGPNDFYDFCSKYDYQVFITYCDQNWGNGDDMLKDLRQRLPLALRDGHLPCDENKINKLLGWLSSIGLRGRGATAVYKIQT